MPDPDSAAHATPLGQLVLVATPIGNLGDLSPRAKAVLAEAAVVCCEDTRRTRALLGALDLDTSPKRLWAVHEHNEAVQARAVVDLVERGHIVAVVSDAGMPGVADPGSRLVDAALSAGVSVSVIPGPSAALAALVVSGQPTERFTFVGFAPRRTAARAALVDELATTSATTVLFESPLRTAQLLADLASALGGARSATVVRELTKVHEEVRRGSLADLAAHYAATPPRGEVVLVLSPSPPRVVDAPNEATVDAALVEALAAGGKVKEAAKAVATRFGLDQRATYDRAVALRNDGTRLGGPSSPAN